MTLLGSASKLFRSLQCPASEHLPVGREMPERALEAGRRGTAIHTVGELLGAGKSKDAALAAITAKYRKEAAELDWQHYPAMVPHARREIAFAHHGQTGQVRVLGESIGRNYTVEDHFETPGTMDAVIAGYRTLEVYDLKTGRTKVPPAGQNPQLLHGALCAVESIAPQAELIVLGIATIVGKQVKVTDQATVTREELAEHEQKIVRAQRIALRVIEAIKAGEQPELRPGQHCLYCPATCANARER